MLTVKNDRLRQSRPRFTALAGRNAVDRLITDYARLKTLFETPVAGTWLKTMNLSIINAGKSFNQVPDRPKRYSISATPKTRTRTSCLSKCRPRSTANCR